MKRITGLIALMLSTAAWGQIQNPSVVYVLSAPSGSCVLAPPVQVLDSNGAMYTCSNGTWTVASGGGTGTVTSVTFTGDGVVDSSTPSTAVTTSGTVTATVLNQSANLLLAGPTTGAAAAPTFRALVNADFPGTLAPTILLTNMTGTLTSPTLVTPALGTPASGVITNLTGTCTSCNANIAAATAQSITVAGAASAPGLTVSGLPFAGTGTTSFPQLALGSAAPTTWSTSGTYLGIAPPTGFAGNAIDLHAVNGGASVFSVNQVGGVSAASVSTTSSGVALNAGFGTANAKAYTTQTNCTSSASPAVCASAPAGTVVVAAAGTTVQVNTTAVTANSIVIVQEDSSLGTKLSVTCNTTPATAPPTISARTAATSFTITTTTPAANPRCFSYFIIN